MTKQSCMLMATVLVCLPCGCATKQLRISTVGQAETLSEIQYKLVLNNLAMFCLNPNALPSLVALKSGSTQIGDTGQLGFLGVAGLDTKFGSSPSISGSRSIVDQWSVSPVTDDNVLKILQMVYRNATGHPSFLSCDDANDIGHDLSQQIGTNADISTDGDLIRYLTSVYAEKIKPNWKNSAETPPGDGNALPPTAPGVPPIKPIEDDAEGVLGKIKEESIKIEEFSRLFRKTLARVDDDLTNTLDEDFIEYIDAMNPTKGFRAKGTNRDPMATLSPEKRAQVAELEKVLSAVSSDLNVAGKAPRGSSGLAKETIRRVNDIQKELNKIATRLPANWFQICYDGRVPKNACYSGNSESCGRRCTVYVCAEGRQALSDFTLSVLKLSSTFKDSQILTVPSGVQYSPAFSRPANP